MSKPRVTGLRSVTLTPRFGSPTTVALPNFKGGWPGVILYKGRYFVASKLMANVTANDLSYFEVSAFTIPSARPELTTTAGVVEAWPVED